MINLSEVLGKTFGHRTKPRRVTVADSFDILLAEESDKLIDNDMTVQEAIRNVENNGIVFLDEIDKICARSERIGADVSREGVQRDLLPLIEGTTVGTKYGPVKTDHVLFIASGAFHAAKPSDLLPELQGRLPIRVELRALTRDDFRRILTEPKACLIRQYIALMKTEGVDLEFTPDAIDAIADIAAEVNTNVENIGARRLSTVMERILDDISFDASDKAGREDRGRRRLRARPYRRPRQERRSVQIYSVAPPANSSSCPALCRASTNFSHPGKDVDGRTSPAMTRLVLSARPPHPHIERAFAAEAAGGLREAHHQASRTPDQPANAARPGATRRARPPRRSS